MTSQNNIIIQPNTTLNINGTLLMAPGKNIYVAGSININSGTVSAACDGTQWGGIQVSGTNSSTITINNGKIEHSSLGIDNWGGNGVINATNTAFLNNERDFLIIDGTAPVNIKSCTFTLNDNYRTTTANQRINLIRTGDVNILGCKFLNKIIHTSAFTNCSWYAIQGSDLGFKVGNDANGNTTTIENFFYGVRADRISANRTFEVKNATFIGVTVGIESNGYNGITVTNNQFNINPNNMPVIPFKAGLLINTGTGYIVNDNKFVGFNGTTTFGTYIIKTGTAPNSINKNTYTNLTVGNRILQQNRNIIDPIGLSLSCNNHTNCISDVKVENNYDLDAGIAPVQGSNSQPDGNQFSNNGGDADFWSETAAPILRYYNSSSPRTIAEVGGSNPPSQISTIFDNPCSNGSSTGFTITQSEPQNISLSELSSQFDEAEAALNAAKSEYSRVVDGGNKADLIDKIKNRWNRDSAAMRQNLLSKSPNLSTEILLEAAKVGVLSRNNLMQLLIANINSCRDKRFLNSLTTDLPRPLTTTDVQQLRNTPNGRSRKWELEAEIHVQSQKREAASRQIIKDLLSESPVNVTELRNWYEKNNNLEDQYALAESYIQEPQSNRSEAKLKSLTATLAYSDLHTREHNDYIELYGIKSNILKNGRKWEQINAAETKSIRRIATNTKGLAAVQAQNILCLVFKECPTVDIPLVSSAVQTQQFVVPSNNSMVTPTPNSFSAYPNPANSNFTVAYDFKESLENAEILITDAVVGKAIVQQKLNQEKGLYTWNVANVAQGIYYVFTENSEDFLNYRKRLKTVIFARKISKIRI
jgi:Secretion system C-terminal sorting domain